LSTSMENREGFIWFDGEFVDWKDANIHILNHACIMQAQFLK